MKLKDELRKYDSKEMTVHELIEDDIITSPYLQIVIESTNQKVELDDLIKYSTCKGRFSYHEEEDGTDINGYPYTIPYLIFIIY